MKSVISKTVVLLTAAIALLSFTPYFGGEGFEISLNGKVVMQRYNKEIGQVQTLNLNNAAPADVLSIRYYHCGKVATNRVVTIKDGNDKTLKEFRFKDVTEQRGEMSCKVQELLNFKKGSNTQLKLYYTSSELPAGRQVAIVSFGSGQDHASIKK